MNVIEIKGQAEYINSKEDAAELLRLDRDYEDLGDYFLNVFKEEDAERADAIREAEEAKAEAERAQEDNKRALAEIQAVLAEWDELDEDDENYKENMQAALLNIRQIVNYYI